MDAVAPVALRMLLRAAAFIDGLNTRAGELAGVLNYVLLASVIVHVVLRYVFDLNLVQMEELHWHFYAAAFLLGLGYAYVHGSHVRIDLFYELMSPRMKAWVELIGAAVLLLPFCVVIGYYSAEYFWQSWSVNEASDQAGGLPARYVLKFVLLAAIVLLGLQALAAMLRAVVVLASRPSA